MVSVRISITIPHELYEAAKNLNLNFSSAAREGIKAEIDWKIRLNKYLYDEEQQ